jgi:flagellar hook assembly protein FlgD
LAEPAAIAIHDVSGRLVRALRAGSGTSTATWDRRDDDGRTVRPGVYFCSAQIGTTSVKERLVVAP